jgi:hypothetical protein
MRDGGSEGPCGPCGQLTLHEFRTLQRRTHLLPSLHPCLDHIERVQCRRRHESANGSASSTSVRVRASTCVRVLVRAMAMHVEKKSIRIACC